MHFDNTYVKIDLDAIAENFDAVCRKAAGKKVMAVIKADAYGHGAIQIARLLQGKCAFFGVSSILEARELRQNGILDPILILGHAPSSAFELMIRQNIRPTIFRRESAEALLATFSEEQNALYLRYEESHNALIALEYEQYFYQVFLFTRELLR